MPQVPQAELPKPSFFSLLSVRLAILAIAIALIGGGVYYFLNRSVQKSSVMQELTIERCDVDQNGKCDEKDKQIVEGLIGICRQDKTYNPIVDADADGCITAQDRVLLFPNEPYTAPADETANWKEFDSQRDITPGKFDPIPHFRIKYPPSWLREEKGLYPVGKSNERPRLVPQLEFILGAAGHGGPEFQEIRKYPGGEAKYYWGDAGNPDYMFGFAVFNLSDQSVVIEASGIPKAESKKYQDIFDQMLATFTFLDNEQSSTALNLQELNSFPVYPTVTFVKKEQQPPCGKEVSGFSTCGTTLYSWTTTDDYDVVSAWYKNNAPKSGWNKVGSAGSYVGPRDASGQDSYQKGSLIYKLLINASSKETQIQLGIPY